MSFALCIFILLSVLGTSFLSGIFGMAGGMILMGLLAWHLDIPQAMIIHATAQFFANATRAAIHRQHIHRGSLLFYFAGVAVVFALFSLTVFITDKITVFVLLGASPFAALLLPKNMKLDFTQQAHAALCGVVVTFFQLTSGVGGPLLDVFFQTRNLSRHATVATKAFTQATAHVIKFIYFTVVVATFGDSMTGVPLWLLAVIIPVAMLGTHLGKHLLEKLTDHNFYRITQVLVLATGAVYLLKAAQMAW
jgi:uncharacterized membrane protein YfcA